MKDEIILRRLGKILGLNVYIDIAPVSEMEREGKFLLAKKILKKAFGIKLEEESLVERAVKGKVYGDDGDYESWVVPISDEEMKRG